jgi:glycerol-3-phosphate dehydrogenase
MATDAERLDYIRRTALLTSSSIPFHKIIRSYAGLRATSDRGDFIIEEAEGAKGFINVAGYESPGLSAIPAVAKYVVQLLVNISGGLTAKDNFNPIRKKVLRFVELTEEEKRQLIKINPTYGKIVCRCETVTEGEIIDAIYRGARSVKAVKKRTRSGCGRCQGGFCGPRIVEILARELGKSMKDIPYDHSKAYILTEETKSLKRKNK